MGECEEVLECIPTNEVIREEECVTEDGINGFLKVYCHLKKKYILQLKGYLCMTIRAIVVLKIFGK